MTRAIAWVESSGLAEHPDEPGRIVRCALGAFGDPLSLWSRSAPPVPWLSEALFAEALDAIGADETADRAVVAELLAHAEQSFAGVAPPTEHPVVLMPLIHAPVFDARIKRLGLAGGRNSMKSWSAVRWALLEVAYRGPCNIVFAREVQSSMRASSKRLVEERLVEMGLDGFEVQRDIIKHRNGSELSFIGLERNPDSVRSTENVRAVIVEEAHRITANSIRILEPTLRKPGARAIYVWNRVQHSDPVDRMFYDEPAEGNVVVHTSWRDNPFIAPSVVTDVIADLDRDPVTARHVWGGEPLIRSDARVFPSSSFSIADLDEQIPERLTPRWGADWGFSNPTTLVQLYVWGSTLYIRREAYASGLDLDQIPALFAGSDTRSPPRWENPRGYPGIPGALTAKIRADSAWPAYISHLRNVGFARIRAARKGARSVENGIARLKSYDIVVHPSCVHTLDELRTYRFRVDRRTEEILDEIVDANGHCIDAARYACEGLR